MKKSNIIKSGILNENPVFVMFLGTCPTLATTNSLTNAVGMSIAFAVVLMMKKLQILRQVPYQKMILHF